MIPHDVGILVTHQPPYRILDLSGTIQGCEVLRGRSVCVEYRPALFWARARRYGDCPRWPEDIHQRRDGELQAAKRPADMPTDCQSKRQRKIEGGARKLIGCKRVGAGAKRNALRVVREHHPNSLEITESHFRTILLSFLPPPQILFFFPPIRRGICGRMAAKMPTFDLRIFCVV